MFPSLKTLKKWSVMIVQKICQWWRNFQYERNIKIQFLASRTCILCSLFMPSGYLKTRWLHGHHSNTSFSKTVSMFVLNKTREIFSLVMTIFFLFVPIVLQNKLSLPFGKKTAWHSDMFWIKSSENDMTKDRLMGIPLLSIISKRDITDLLLIYFCQLT